MTLHKIAKPLQIFAVLPILTANVVSVNPNMVLPAQNNVSNVVVSQNEQNGPLFGALLDNKQADREEKAKQIDQYFADRNMPLVGYGKKFVEEAEKNNLPWNLLPSIAVIESSGYINACKNPRGLNNGFGWGSCKIAFKSVDEAIETVAFHLGGNHPKTSHYYKGKDVVAVLNTYNPPQYRHDYVPLVTSVMKKMENQTI